MKDLICLVALFMVVPAFAISKVNSLPKDLKGVWVLKAMTCNGAAQSLTMNYTLSFEGKNGAYVSKTTGCIQVEPELYTYPKPNVVTIKQGVRSCSPNPCQADLPADRCGKETNPKLPSFKVEFKDRKNTMILSTSDPNSIDCTDAGQSKPAVFTFVRQKA
jgi:hypothetical protein